MTKSNLSKNDLLEICSSLGLPTEGNKMDLVQKLKEYSGVISYEKGKKRHYRSNEKCTTWNIPLEELPRNIEEISDCQPQTYRETRKRKSLIEE
ncbi:8846_t:CDS:2, partial [Cetraspora pellucida]